jgi:hypothetical protein
MNKTKIWYLRGDNMKYRYAKQLHNGDEVTIKETGAVLTVVEAYKPEPTKNTIIVLCDDGNEYHHRDIR